MAPCAHCWDTNARILMPSCHLRRIFDQAPSSFASLMPYVVILHVESAACGCGYVAGVTKVRSRVDSSQSLGHLLSLLVWRTFDFAWPCYLPCRHMSQVNKDCTAVQVGLWLATRASCNQLHVLCCIPLESMQRGLVRGERPTERAWHGCQSCGFCAARSR